MAKEVHKSRPVSFRLHKDMFPLFEGEAERRHMSVGEYAAFLATQAIQFRAVNSEEEAVRIQDWGDRQLPRSDRHGHDDNTNMGPESIDSPRVDGPLIGDIVGHYDEGATTNDSGPSDGHPNQDIESSSREDQGDREHDRGTSRGSTPQPDLPADPTVSEPPRIRGRIATAFGTDECADPTCVNGTVYNIDTGHIPCPTCR